MNKAGRYGLATAFVVGLFAVGLPYWAIPYNKVSLPNTLVRPELLTIVLGTLLLGLFRSCRFRVAVLVVGTAVPAAVLARVIVECAKDPTSHNLWPFEIVFAVGVGLLASLAGAAMAALVNRFVPVHKTAR
jgi:hypothetical protein